MTVVTVPLDNTMMNMLNNILSWTSTTKADIFRNALRYYHHNELISRLEKASKEAKKSPVYRGKLSEVAAKFND